MAQRWHSRQLKKVFAARSFSRLDQRTNPRFCCSCLLQVATEKDFIDAVNKVIKAYAKFSSTPRYMTYN